MLLKALEEVGLAPNAMMAAEMAIIRLTHVADLPSPEELIRRIQAEPPAPLAPPDPGPQDGGGAQARAPLATHGGRTLRMAATAQHAPVRAETAPAPIRAAPAPERPETQALARYESFADVVALVRARRDMALLIEIETGLRLARYSPGRIEFEPTDGAAPDLAARLAARLQSWTGARWGVSVVGSGGAATLAETRDATRTDLQARAAEHPLVQAVLAAFPGARIEDVRPPEPAMEADEDAALERAEDDDWDPLDPFHEEN